MIWIINVLVEVLVDYDVLFCDLWGCLYNGVVVYLVVVVVLCQFCVMGGQVVLLINVLCLWKYVVVQLDWMGVLKDVWDVIVSFGDVVQDVMFFGVVGCKVWVIVMEKDEGFFIDILVEYQNVFVIQCVLLDQVEGIVCCGLFDDEIEIFEDYCNWLIDVQVCGLKLFCVNFDLIVDLGEKWLYCVGVLVEFYEDLGGILLYFGKLYVLIYDLVCKWLGLVVDVCILVIGDGILIDVFGVWMQGIDVLFVLGGLVFDQFGDDIENLEVVMLEEWLFMCSEDLKYVIGRFW